jgi:hypothetical protein
VRRRKVLRDGFSTPICMPAAVAYFSSSV